VDSSIDDAWARRVEIALPVSGNMHVSAPRSVLFAGSPPPMRRVVAGYLEMTMPDDKLGKTDKRDEFPIVKTPETAAKESAAQSAFNQPGAVPLEVYFAVRQIKDPAARAARAAFTPVRLATIEAWDEIFKASF
jgi:hypothetical protein